jgi:hypothetical protein
VNIGPASEAPFGDDESFLDFLGQNELSHISIGKALALNGYILTSAPPIGNPLETSDWMLDHWQRHREECLPLGIPVPDLSTANLRDEVEYEDWMQLHAILHEQENSLLGITS